MIGIHDAFCSRCMALWLQIVKIAWCNEKLEKTCVVEVAFPMMFFKLQVLFFFGIQYFRHRFLIWALQNGHMFWSILAPVVGILAFMVWTVRKNHANANRRNIYHCIPLTT